MVDKKVLLLAVVAAIIIAGMLLTPDGDNTATLRYILNGVGLILIPFIGAWIGISGAKHFTFKSTLGKALLFISLGVISYGLGTIVFFIYNMFLSTEIAYPSLADIGFFCMIPLAVYGLFLVLKQIRPKMDAKTIIKVTILPVVVLAVIFPFFIYGKIGENVPWLTKALNIFYPLGDVLFLSIALVILSLTYGSVLFKSLIVLSIGFIIEAIADFSFAYTATLGTYYTSCWVDVVYCLAFFTIGLGMYKVYSSQLKFASKT